MSTPIAMVDFTPLLPAVMVCWVFSVCVHEFAHALVAYWGGDLSVRRKGYLSFNPFVYLHPVTSILIPCVFLAMGGIPLPGGAVYIDHRALRSRHWAAAVSAAGPVSNFLLFAAIAAVLHPARGLVDPTLPVQPVWVQILGAMAVLQLISVFFNLIPIPPLDGFGILSPYVGSEMRQWAARLGWGGLFGLYVLFVHVESVMDGLVRLVDTVLTAFGLPYAVTWEAYRVALWG